MSLRLTRSLELDASGTALVLVLLDEIERLRSGRWHVGGDRASGRASGSIASASVVRCAALALDFGARSLAEAARSDVPHHIFVFRGGGGEQLDQG